MYLIDYFKSFETYPAIQQKKLSIISSKYSNAIKWMKIRKCQTLLKVGTEWTF